MASLYKKVISGRPYWYLREMGWADGKPMLTDLGIAGIIDEAAGSRRADAGASAGTYLVLAALNRLVAPCSKLAFADWWKSTAADRFTKIPARVLDHRRFWDAMHAVTLDQLEQASRQIAVK